MSDIESMEEFAARVVRYRYDNFDEAFEGIKADFLSASPAQRKQWLEGWDASMSQETRVTKDHAEWITKKRELDDLHALLTRAGR
jgi:hypothetical protein